MGKGGRIYKESQQGVLIHYNENREPRKRCPKANTGFEERVINCAAGKTSETISRKQSQNLVANMKITDALTRAVFSKAMGCKPD